MNWELRYSRDGFSVEAAIKKKRALPEWYLDEPSIDEVGVFYISSFLELNTTRYFDMGRVPWGECLRYAKHKGLDKGNINTFISIIGRLDDAYLSWVASQRAKNQ